MFNPNYIVTLFFLWMIGFRVLQTWCEYVEAQKTKLVFEDTAKGPTKLRDIYFLVYVIVGGILFGLAVLVWVFGN